MWLRAQNKSLVNLDNVIGLSTGVTGEQASVFVNTPNRAFPIYTTAGGSRPEKVLRDECQKVLAFIYDEMRKGTRLVEIPNGRDGQ